MNRRIWVVGNTGSGKSTLARELAQRLGVPHVELDALYHQEGWIPAHPEVFLAAVDEATSGDGWVVDGNYQTVAGTLLERADVVVWLDLPLRVVWPRVVRRSVARALDKVELWNGNRERARSWVRASHPIWWSLTHATAYRRRYEALADDRFVRLRSPRQAEEWLASVVP